MAIYDLSVVGLANQYLINLAENNYRDYSYFHPSEFDVCHRKLAYLHYEHNGNIKVKQDALKVDTQLQRIFDVGHVSHDRWRKYLEDSGHFKGVWVCSNHFFHKDKPQIFGKEEKYGIYKPDKCECGSTSFSYEEVGFRDDATWFRGHVDAILEVNPQDKTIAEMDAHIIVDFKTISPYQFKNLFEPKPEHKTQMQIYLFLANVNIGKLVYEDKGTQDVREFRVVRDEKFIQKRIEEAKKLRYQLTHLNENGKKVLPCRKYDIKTEYWKKRRSLIRKFKDCKYCQYKTHCWKLQ